MSDLGEGCVHSVVGEHGVRVDDFGVKTCKPVNIIARFAFFFFNGMIQLFKQKSAIGCTQSCVLEASWMYFIYVLLIIFVDGVFSISPQQANKSHFRDSICTIFIISASQMNAGQVSDGGCGA